MQATLGNGLRERYGAWLLRRRPSGWSIGFHAALGALLLAFSGWLSTRNVEAAALWWSLGCLALAVAHSLFVTSQAGSTIERLENENAELQRTGRTS